MDNNNGGKKLIVILVAVILVAAFLAIWFSARGTKPLNGVQPEAISFSAAQKVNELGALDVPDQFPGLVAFVSRVDLPAGGFVVIKKNNAGQPGDVIGATFFDKDTRIGNVDLSEATVDGQSYWAEAWTDNGDAVFSLTADKIVTKADAVGDALLPLRVQFKATKDLPERKG